jgi:hypothetical protein
MTFNHGIPSFYRLITTPHGLATVRRFNEDGTINLYVGYGRTLIVSGSTTWREA